MRLSDGCALSPAYLVLVREETILNVACLMKQEEGVRMSVRSIAIT